MKSSTVARLIGAIAVGTCAALAALMLAPGTALAGALVSEVSDTVPNEMTEALLQVETAKAALRDSSNASALQELEAEAQAPVKVLYVSENQPVHIVDSQGRLIQVIYLKRK